MSTMDHSETQRICQWILFCLHLVLWLQDVHGQSCGPRVSARLLAEIPCDMSKSSYCSAPGSAYPWNSVKRYINDNQGLVRRMYGDEKHSSVLLNEIDGFQLKFDQLRSFMSRGYSRTEYGRSARGSRRQPRPQIFEDDDDDGTPATIFRVVTETSIKVGDPVTKPLATEQSSPTYESATADYDIASHEHVSTTTTMSATTSATSSSTTEHVSQTETRTETVRDTTYASTTPETTSTTTIPSSTETTTQATASTTSAVPELPVAMERIGYEDIADYDYEPDRKAAASSVLQNSVEEKVKHKQESNDVKRNDPMKYDEDSSMYDVVADDIKEKSEPASTEGKKEEAAEEEVPRRGINACPVKNEVIAPYWANNTRGETLALLNVHPFEQYVHFEKCAFENHQMLCREGCRCEQQYRLHRLLAFDPKNECRGIFSDWFRFPSCCVCICYDLTPDIPRTRSRKSRMK